MPRKITQLLDSRNRLGAVTSPEIQVDPASREFKVSLNLSTADATDPRTEVDFALWGSFDNGQQWHLLAGGHVKGGGVFGRNVGKPPILVPQITTHLQRRLTNCRVELNMPKDLRISVDLDEDVGTR